MPGLATSSAEQIIAEIGATAATFPSPRQLASWVGVCPGREESAGVSTSNRSPKGNHYVRRVLHQCAWPARTRGSFFETLFRRLVPRIGVCKAIWAVAHRILRLIGRILHWGDRYQERGPSVAQAENLQRRFRRMAKQMAAGLSSPTHTTGALVGQLGFLRKTHASDRLSWVQIFESVPEFAPSAELTSGGQRFSKMAPQPRA